MEDRQRQYTWLPFLMIGMVIIAIMIGSLVLISVKNRLVATSGETLALAAADIADKLNRLLYERYLQTESLAKVPVLHTHDAVAITQYLQRVKEDYPVYQWLGVTDPSGRVVAATDPATVGIDWSERLGFRIARLRGSIDVQDAEILEGSGGMPVVRFTAPLRDAHGQFQGVLSTWVGLRVMTDVFESTLRTLHVHRGREVRLEWQFLTADGDLILDSLLKQEGKVNLKRQALLSALFAGSAQPGYVEEEHLRRHVSVVSGYAQTEGYGRFTGLHWGVLVRMDRSDVLASMNALLIKLVLGGTAIFLPMLGLLLWATGQLRMQWLHEQEQAKWLSTTLTSIGDAVIATDERGQVRFMNPIAEALTGWSQEDAQGKSLVEVFRIINEGTRKPVENPVAKVIREDGIVGLANHTILIARDQTERAIDDSAAPIRDHRGIVIGVILVFRDITERKQAEAAIQQAEEQLRQSQKIEAIGRLAGGIAHDFNNLLTAILGYCGLLMPHLQHEEAWYSSAKEIEKAADRGATLTRQLLAFSRKQILLPQVLHLNGAVQRLQPMLRRLIGEDIELLLALSPDVRKIHADPGQMEQVILNLVLNARDAMPTGGRLRIETANVSLDEKSDSAFEDLRAGNYVLLAISDTGRGMDAEVQRHMFEPFFTTKEQGKGTGLGLSTVYGVVKQSGGHIRVESQVDKGSTFSIYLPACQESHEAVVPCEPDVRLSGPETVLVVEDEDAVRELIRTVLEQYGYTTLIARSSSEAFRVAAAYGGHIDLLLTDLVMPGMNGRELVERLASSRPAMKILYISGYMDDAIMRHGLQTASVAFLQKPFAAATLLKKMREVLDAQTADRL